MVIMAPRKRSKSPQPSAIQARISDAEREYLDDLAERMNTSMSGAVRIALGLALDFEIRHGELELTEDETEDDSIPFDAEFVLLKQRRRSKSRPGQGGRSRSS
jgi:hypothetical protein